MCILCFPVPCGHLTCVQLSFHKSLSFSTANTKSEFQYKLPVLILGEEVGIIFTFYQRAQLFRELQKSVKSFRITNYVVHWLTMGVKGCTHCTRLCRFTLQLPRECMHRTACRPQELRSCDQIKHHCASISRRRHLTRRKVESLTHLFC